MAIRNRVPGFMQVVRPAGQIPPRFQQPNLHLGPNAFAPSDGGSSVWGIAVVVPSAPATSMVFNGVPDPDAAAIGMTCDQVAAADHTRIESAILNWFSNNPAFVAAANLAHTTPAALLGTPAVNAQVINLASLIIYNCNVQKLLAQASALQTQGSALAGQISTLQGQAQSLSGQVSTLFGQVSTLNNASAQKDQTISGLNTAAGLKDQQILTLSNQIAAIPPSQSAAATTISDLSTQLSAAQAAVSAATAKAGGITLPGMLVGAVAGVAGTMLLRPSSSGRSSAPAVANPSRRITKRISSRKSK